MNDHAELAGRVAVVTGAGRNIGRAIALGLAAGGAAVVVNGRQNKPIIDAVVRDIEASGGQAMSCMADVSNPGAVEVMFDAVVTRFGRVDYLVNNAALRREQFLEDIDPTSWRDVMSVTLDGQFCCVRSALPLLKASGAAAIVSIGGLSVYTGAKGRAHVVAAKSALIGLTRALAADLAEHNVTANLVSPGLISSGPDQPARSFHSMHTNLAGTYGTPQDVADLVRFLCGPGARYITGQTLHVNGGAFFGF